MLSSSHDGRHHSRRRPFDHGRAAHGRARLVPQVRVRVEQHATVAVLRVSGEFDLCGVDQVEHALDRAVDSLTDQLVLDLRGVSFLDVSGVHTILRADERGRCASYSVEVVAPAALVARIFTLTDTGRRLTFVDPPV